MSNNSDNSNEETQTTETVSVNEDIQKRREEWVKRQEELRLKKEEQIVKMKEHYVEVLQGQTTLSEDEAKKMLEENNYNVQACIRIFMGLPAERPNMSCASSSKTINQGIYNNIRGLMDEAAYRYEKKKEMETKIEAMRAAYANTHNKEITN